MFKEYKNSSYWLRKRSTVGGKAVALASLALIVFVDIFTSLV